MKTPPIPTPARLEREFALHGQARELLSQAFHLQRAGHGGESS